MFFYLLKLTCFFSKINRVFSEIGNNSMRALGRKKHMFSLVMRGLNLMLALIQNREKNLVAFSCVA